MFNSVGKFIKSVLIPNCKIYGLFPLRGAYGGQIVVLVEYITSGRTSEYKYLYFDGQLNNKRPLGAFAINFSAYCAETGQQWTEDGEKRTIRFSAAFGNRIILSDMRPKGQCVWITDTRGNIVARSEESKVKICLQNL